jgi:hypothetical protein
MQPTAANIAGSKAEKQVSVCDTDVLRLGLYSTASGGIFLGGTLLSSMAKWHGLDSLLDVPQNAIGTRLVRDT